MSTIAQNSKTRKRSNLISNSWTPPIFLSTLLKILILPKSHPSTLVNSTVGAFRISSLTPLHKFQNVSHSFFVLVTLSILDLQWRLLNITLTNLQVFFIRPPGLFEVSIYFWIFTFNIYINGTRLMSFPPSLNKWNLHWSSVHTSAPNLHLLRNVHLLGPLRDLVTLVLAQTDQQNTEHQM